MGRRGNLLVLPMAFGAFSCGEWYREIPTAFGLGMTWVWGSGLQFLFCPVAVDFIAAAYQKQTLPGFRIFFGSKTCLMPCIRAMGVSPYWRRRYSFLA